MYTLYVLTFESGKKYVGITTTTLKRRLSGHARDARIGDGRAVCAAWRKYGAPKADVIEMYKTRDELIAAEIATIKALNTLCPNGYNMSEGYYNSPSLSPEAAAKISAANKGKRKPPRSEEHCRNMSIAKTGKKMPPRTQEHRDALSAARKGIEFSQEWRDKIGKAQIGRKHSDETNAKRKSTWATKTKEQNMESARKRMETRRANAAKLAESQA